MGTLERIIIQRFVALVGSSRDIQRCFNPNQDLPLLGLAETVEKYDAVVQN